MKTLKDETAAPLLEREVVADIVGIVYLARVWISPDGMLDSNHLLDKEQTKCLLIWCDIIETCFIYLLDDAKTEAFADFEDYLDGDYGAMNDGD